MKALICCDYGIAGQYVLNEAQKFLATVSNAEIQVFTVIDMAAVSVAGMYNNGEVLVSLEREADELNKLAQRVFAGREIGFSSAVGYPGDTIVQKAASLEADLLVIGTRGKTGLNRLVLGSVAEHVLRHATCNTLVIPIKRYVMEELPPG